jgi:hypothetical protein
MKRLEQRVWKYISRCVDEENYLPTVDQVEEHFDSPQTPIELMEMIPEVRADYIQIHDLKGVKINDETVRVCA